MREAVLGPIASAPPSVFSPYTGLEQGTRSRPAIAERGSSSQLTVSPNGSLMRTPSR
jgi:hypothetical protein